MEKEVITLIFLLVYFCPLWDFLSVLLIEKIENDKRN